MRVRRIDGAPSAVYYTPSFGYARNDAIVDIFPDYSVLTRSAIFATIIGLYYMYQDRHQEITGESE